MKTKKNPLDNPALFPQGTVIEILDDSIRTNHPGYHVVKCIAQNGVRSYVAITYTKDTIGDMELDFAINLSYSIRIVERSNGSVVFESPIRGCSEVTKGGIRGFLIREIRDYRQAPDYVHKGKGELYLGPSYKYDHLLRAIIKSMMPRDAVLDDTRFMLWLEANKVCFKKHPMLFNTEELNWYYVTVNKKKLLRSIRQNINRLQGRVKDALRVEDDDYERQEYERFLDEEETDLNNRIESRIVSDVREVINEYGFIQSEQCVGNGEYAPVCSQCNACMMPNRGQGTICDSCDRDIFDDR